MKVGPTHSRKRRWPMPNCMTRPRAAGSTPWEELRADNPNFYETRDNIVML